MNREEERDESQRDRADRNSKDEDAAWSGKEEDNVDQDDNSDYPAHTLQLMDTHEMQALRAALNRTEIQIRQQGHVQEYVPRKPASSKLRRWYGLPRDHRATNRPTMSAGPTSRLENSDLSPMVNASNQLRERPSTSTRPKSRGIKTADFARALKHETRQVRDLEHRYEETKRALLDYIDVVTSCKPNDRVGGHEVYEQLADLTSFATQSSGPE